MRPFQPDFKFSAKRYYTSGVESILLSTDWRLSQQINVKYVSKYNFKYAHEFNRKLERNLYDSHKKYF